MNPVNPKLPGAKYRNLYATRGAIWYERAVDGRQAVEVWLWGGDPSSGDVRRGLVRGRAWPMSIDRIPLSELAEERLDQFVKASIAERRRIEYKARLPASTDAGRREFRFDVASFANSVGGTIYFGIPEKSDGSGEPESLAGLGRECRPDEEIGRLEETLLHGIDPRIPSWRIRSVPLSGDRGPVVVLRIRQSWFRPHAVTSGEFPRFLARRTNGKYAMDCPVPPVC